MYLFWLESDILQQTTKWSKSQWVSTVGEECPKDSIKLVTSCDDQVQLMTVLRLEMPPGPSFINCPYYAHNGFWRGAQYGHRNSCYSCFTSPFEDAQQLYSRCNLHLLPLWCGALLSCIKPCLYTASRSWQACLNFWMMLTSQHGVSDPTDWLWHIAARHFYLTLTLLLRLFDVRCECKINV